MIQYFAIIKDSFREAAVSWVLWVLMGMATVVLLVIAPLSIKEQQSAGLAPWDFNNTNLFALRILQEREQSDSLAKHIYDRFQPEFRAELADLAEAEQSEIDPQRAFAVMREFVKQMDLVLTLADFYDAKLWKGKELGEEASKLLAQGVSGLSDRELKRFNRILLSVAFPADIRPAREVDYQMAYLGRDVSKSFSFNKEKTIARLIIWFLDYLLAPVGMLVAIVFSAFFMPRTFEAGSIDLLLSKPVSRPFLFLAKFAGSCAFISINVLYLVGGLWLILGIRTGMWSSNLLLTIPLFIFMFAICYSVSAFVGLLSRSVIISVAATVLFWGICFMSGCAQTQGQEFLRATEQLTSPFQVGSSTLVQTEVGEVKQWVADTKEWRLVFFDSALTPPPLFAMGQSVQVGPKYDAQKDRLLGFYREFSTELIIGKSANRWAPEPGPVLPRDAMDLIVSRDGDVYILGMTGIQRLTETQGDANAGQFVPVTDGVLFMPPFAAAVTPRGDIAVCDAMRLALFKRQEDGTFKLADQLRAPSRVQGHIAAMENGLLLARGDKVSYYDMGLKLVREKTLGDTASGTVKTLIASPDGRQAFIHLHSQELWIFKQGTGEFQRPDLPAQKEVCGIGFTTAGGVLIVHDYTWVTEYTADFQKMQVFRGTPGAVEKTYRYAIAPLYAVLPKPTQLTHIVKRRISEKKDEDEIAFGARPATPKYQGWTPVWSSLIFVAVLLALSCIYVSRKDF